MQAKSESDGSTVRTGVRKVRVDRDTAGQRIDNFLRRQLPGLPKGRMYRMLRRGEVRVNGGRVRPEYKLAAGDEVRIPPARLKAPGDAPDDRAAAAMLRAILFEDRELLVVDKPAGVAVHGGSGVSHGVVELLRASRPDLKDLSLAHRIDRETSGCLVLAKRRSALRRLHTQFRENLVAKNYLALVHGDWQHGEQLLDSPLLVTHRKNGERHVIVSDRGKPAATRVRLSRRLPGFSLVQCEPSTGRTHQIRVHLAHAGHPIAGDDRYGLSAPIDGAPKVPRLFLHAQSIAFAGEGGNDRLFTAGLPDDLEGYLNALSTVGQGRK